jgi:hypothetical protein
MISMPDGTNRFMVQPITQPDTGITVHTENIPGMGCCKGLLVLPDGKLLMCSDTGNICSREPTWYTSATNERVYEQKIEALADFDGLMVHRHGTVVTCNRGVIRKKIPDISISAEKFENPRGIVLKYGPGNIPSYIVAEKTKLSHYMFTPNTVFASGFNNPTSIIAVPGKGQYIVADCGNHRIVLLDIGGNMNIIAGNGEGFRDGQGNEAQFSAPHGLALKEDGSIVVADYGNNAVRLVTMDGLVTTIAGNGEKGCVDAEGDAARFHGPTDVVVLNKGLKNHSIIVADRDNNLLREINGNKVTTIAGGAHGTADGAGPDARFSFPEYLAVDERGRLLVTESERKDTLRVVEMRVVEID